MAEERSRGRVAPQYLGCQRQIDQLELGTPVTFRGREAAQTELDHALPEFTAIEVVAVEDLVQASQWALVLEELLDRMLQELLLL